jgi:hypothetical protein
VHRTTAKKGGAKGGLLLRMWLGFLSIFGRQNKR